MSSCLYSWNQCLQKEKHLNNLKEEVVSFSPFPLSSWLSWLWRGHWRVGCWSSPHGGPRLPPYLPTHQSTTPHPSTSLTATYTHTHTHPLTLTAANHTKPPGMIGPDICIEPTIEPKTRLQISGAEISVSNRELILFLQLRDYGNKLGPIRHQTFCGG